MTIAGSSGDIVSEQLQSEVSETGRILQKTYFKTDKFIYCLQSVSHTGGSLYIGHYAQAYHFVSRIINEIYNIPPPNK